MLRKIDKKVIDNAFKFGNGDVMIEYGVFENRYETRIVEKPIPVLGRIFPFLKHKVREQYVAGNDLVLEHKSVSDAVRAGNSAPKIIKDQLQAIPYDRMFHLDKSIYGNLILAHVVKDRDWAGDQKYDILTEDGVLLGRFDMQYKGYYNPVHDNKIAHLPEDVKLEDVVARYCAANPETIDHIPEETYQKFPNLAQTLVNEIDAQNDASRSQTKASAKSK